MSDTDSDSSTDSDNNNESPFFNHYWRIPRVHDYGHNIESPALETDNSSDSEIIPNLDDWDSTSSDVSFQKSIPN